MPLCRHSCCAHLLEEFVKEEVVRNSTSLFLQACRDVMEPVFQPQPLKYVESNSSKDMGLEGEEHEFQGFCQPI